MLKHTQIGACSGQDSPVAVAETSLTISPSTFNSTQSGGSTTQSKNGMTPTPSSGVSRCEGDSGSIKLPQRFVVKYLGYRDTNGLWGIKYTRSPVDQMVSRAKTLLSTTNETLALLKLEVMESGISLEPMPQNSNSNFPCGKYGIASISYGVQDLVYTRVFAMIIVKADGQPDSKMNLEDDGSSESESNPQSLDKDSISDDGHDRMDLPFRCHAFVTDTRETARRLTYALATAFQAFSRKVETGKIGAGQPSKRFAIDLRTPEEFETDGVEGMDSSEA